MEKTKQNLRWENLVQKKGEEKNWRREENVCTMQNITRPTGSIKTTMMPMVIQLKRKRLQAGKQSVRSSLRTSHCQISLLSLFSVPVCMFKTRVGDFFKHRPSRIPANPSQIPNTTLINFHIKCHLKLRNTNWKWGLSNTDLEQCDPLHFSFWFMHR